MFINIYKTCLVIDTNLVDGKILLFVAKFTTS